MYSHLIGGKPPGLIGKGGGENQEKKLGSSLRENTRAAVGDTTLRKGSIMRQFS